MFTSNIYFEGKVQSFAFSPEAGPATIGVMAPGDYEFGTSTEEIMTVISGKMMVQLPGDDNWNEFQPFTSFRVAKDQKFKVRVTSDTAYLCLYK